jgi:hypothetical protein
MIVPHEPHDLDCICDGGCPEDPCGSCGACVCELCHPESAHYLGCDQG